METRNTLTSKVSFNLLKEYYKAMSEACNYANYDLLEDFRKEHSKEFSFLNQIHQKRTNVNRNIEAMKYLSKPLYFGTLTFNTKKDKNKIVCKRKEAFLKLNKLFEALLLVEEFGENKGRYHIHFVGVFRYNCDFDDFRKCWHSRQNLEKVENDKNVGQYLVKYVCKDVPRLRRNKGLIRLEKAYSRGKRLQRNFPSLGIKYQVNKLLALNLFEEL